MSWVRFVVPGEPIPWERARSGGGRRFTAPRTAVFQTKVQMAARKHFRRPLAGALALRVVAYRSTARRCDWDNLGKTVSDALNGLAWEDDAQVDDGRVVKRLDRERPRTEVWVAHLVDELGEPAL